MKKIAYEMHGQEIYLEGVSSVTREVLYALSHQLHAEFHRLESSREPNVELYMMHLRLERLAQSMTEEQATGVPFYCGVYAKANDLPDRGDHFMLPDDITVYKMRLNDAANEDIRSEDEYQRPSVVTVFRRAPGLHREESKPGFWQSPEIHWYCDDGVFRWIKVDDMLARGHNMSNSIMRESIR